MVDKLFVDGKKLFVVTSKPADIAKRIIEHFELDSKFVCVIGPDRSERSPSKKELIERAISDNFIDDKSKVVMIGDRKYDIEGANEAGVDSVGALYGYGSYEELKTAGATYLVKIPEEIYEITCD